MPSDLGAVLAKGGIRFRVWAPAARRVEVEIASGARGLPLEAAGDGTWSGSLSAADGGVAGLRYKYRVDGEGAFPDPYSRSQPEGVHGPSEVVDPGAYGWHDADWRGLGIKGVVIYECHVGTATPEGTFDSLIGQLDRLKRLGVNAIQLMPVAEFSGSRNWGYDGVFPFAPSRSYGGVHGLMRLVDAAHQRGLGVLLDVVYNHLGPEGNYLRQFSPYYFTDRHQTPWGEAINYDGPHSDWVRKLVLDNALQWIHQFHLDGLRLDATHEIHDDSERHILQELTQTVRASLPPGRQVVLIAETSENDVRYLLPPEQGGHGLDAVWADDFHHSLRRYLAGDSEGYYADYEGTLAEVARCVEQGFLYEGQPGLTSGVARGTPAREQPAWQFVFALQNHDQVGNRAFGDRLHHGPGVDLDCYRAASALLLLLPQTPMLFQGQEFAASSPFQYFTDHSPDLGRLVTEGRRSEFKGFSAFADPAVAETIPDPQAEATFLRSKLRLGEAEEQPGAAVQALYTELLRLRREDAAIAAQDRRTLRAWPATPDVLAVQMGRPSDCRLLLANFGDSVQLDLSSLAPETRVGGRETSGAQTWQPVFSTDDRRLGGSGQEATVQNRQVTLPARTAVLLSAGERAAC